MHSDYSSENLLMTLYSIREYTPESEHGAPEGPWWENRDLGCSHGGGNSGKSGKTGITVRIVGFWHGDKKVFAR